MRNPIISGSCVLLLLISACNRPVNRAGPSDDAKSGASTASTTHTNAKPVAPPPAIEADAPADYPGLHNVVTYAPGRYSGSVPEGDAGFDTLAAWGVQTIISVDGARPDVELARARGMRYVHLPIGYNGMDRRRTLEIARAIRDLPGPVYLHCHHGKHRSAGALGAAVVTLGLSTPDEAIGRMKVSGTSPSYTGLYQCVTLASMASTEALDAADDSFPQTWKTSGLVKTMVEIDEVFERLRAIEKAGWRPPVDHPDLVPVAEAGRLADLLRNLRDDEQVRAKPAEFRSWLLSDSALCESLESGLADASMNAAQLSETLSRISQSCKDCHTRYRDR